jgi:hypothetical protein
MKKYLLALCLATGAMAANAQNIDIQLGQSNYYGRIDLMNFGTPQLIYKEPMWIDRPANYRSIAPVYLRVPPGHAKKWSKHCDRYDACGRPVYFVQDSWYNNTYVPRYQKVKGGGKDKARDHDDDHNFRLSDRPGTQYDARAQRDDGHKDKGHKDKGHKDKGDKGHGGGNGKGNGKH